ANHWVVATHLPLSLADSNEHNRAVHAGGYQVQLQGVGHPELADKFTTEMVFGKTAQGDYEPVVLHIGQNVELPRLSGLRLFVPLIELPLSRISWAGRGRYFEAVLPKEGLNLETLIKRPQDLPRPSSGVLSASNLVRDWLDLSEHRVVDSQGRERIEKSYRAALQRPSNTLDWLVAQALLQDLQESKHPWAAKVATALLREANQPAASQSSERSKSSDDAQQSLDPQALGIVNLLKPQLPTREQWFEIALWSVLVIGSTLFLGPFAGGLATALAAARLAAPGVVALIQEAFLIVTPRASWLQPAPALVGIVSPLGASDDPSDPVLQLSLSPTTVQELARLVQEIERVSHLSSLGLVPGPTTSNRGYLEISKTLSSIGENLMLTFPPSWSEVTVPSEVPVVSWQEVLDELNRLLAPTRLVSGRWHAAGRTIIIPLTSGHANAAFKLARFGQSEQALFNESAWSNRLTQLEYNLFGATLPQPMLIRASPVVGLSTWPSVDGLPDPFKLHPRRLTSVFLTHPRYYDSYLDSPRHVTPEEFLAGIIRLAYQLGYLTAKGIYHQEILPLFHKVNIEDPDEPFAWWLGGSLQWHHALSQWSNAYVMGLRDPEHLIHHSQISLTDMVHAVGTVWYNLVLLSAVYVMNQQPRLIGGLSATDAAKAVGRYDVGLLEQALRGAFDAFNKGARINIRVPVFLAEFSHLLLERILVANVLFPEMRGLLEVTSWRVVLELLKKSQREVSKSVSTHHVIVSPQFAVWWEQGLQTLKNTVQRDRQRAAQNIDVLSLIEAMNHYTAVSLHHVDSLAALLVELINLQPQLEVVQNLLERLTNPLLLKRLESAIFNEVRSVWQTYLEEPPPYFEHDWRLSQHGRMQHVEKLIQKRLNQLQQRENSERSSESPEPLEDQRTGGGRVRWLQPLYDRVEIAVGRRFGERVGWIVGQVLLPVVLESGPIVLVTYFATPFVTPVISQNIAMLLPFTLSPPIAGFIWTSLSVSIVWSILKVVWHALHGSLFFAPNLRRMTWTTAIAWFAGWWAAFMMTDLPIFSVETITANLIFLLIGAEWSVHFTTNFQETQPLERLLRISRKDQPTVIRQSESLRGIITQLHE
ncbi:MAG: hypothetical protein HYY57_01915, partial [Candidatus Omnitrophica bacterium]|nr:hypothetical protein [Candidatus Omnitrophota bacterium]